MSELRFRLRPLFLGFVVLLLDCASLDKLAPDACGNGVVEPKTEDCDTFPNDPDATKARCGAPTEGAFACHLRCGVSKIGASVCPEGWGCDTKGICREPSGNFSSALGFVSGGAVHLTVGDFDGDGRKDLVASGPRNPRSGSSVRVHYFNDTGGLAQVASLPTAVVSPAVFDRDHNGRDAIAFGVPALTKTGLSALGVVSGLADRTFLPVIFPAATLPDTNAVPVFVFEHAADVKLPSGNDSTIILFAETTDGSAIVSLDAELGGTAKLTRPLPAKPDAIRGRPVTARLFDLDPGSACGEVVVAMQVAPLGRLVVLSPCAPAPKSAAGIGTRWSVAPSALKSFVLPALADLSRGVLVTDVDGDGHLDVLVDTNDKDGPQILWGNGTTLQGPTKWAPAGLTSDPKMPLAAGDLTNDGKVDYVFPNFVAVQRNGVVSVADAGADAGPVIPVRDGTLIEPPVELQQLTPWSDAAIGRFNADFFADFVTIHSGAPDIEVFAGGTGGFTPSTVTTDGIVQAIARGDFDGDHIDDLAFTQTASGGTSTLSIAYGRPNGSLEPPTRIGSVDQQKGLTVLPHGGLPADLGLFAVAAPLAGHSIGSTSLTLLTGSGDRQPLALLFYVDVLSCGRTTSPCMMRRPSLESVSRQWSPLSLLAGPIVAEDSSAVVTYAVGTSTPSKGSMDTFGVWIASSDGTVPGGISAPTEQLVLDGLYDAYDDSTRAAKLATAIKNIDTLDTGGLSEIIAISNKTNGHDAALVVVRPGRVPLNQEQVLTGLQVTPSAQLEAFDIDGDGFRDAVGLFGAPPNAQIVAFLNDGKGAFVLPGVPLIIPPPAPGATDDGTPVAFAGIAVHGSPAVSGASAQNNAIAVVTATSVVLATLRPDKHGFDVKSLSSLLGKQPLNNATGIAAGDFNGDGVEDIAVANGGLRLILQQPARSGK
jgi:hypothetical protein